MAPHYGCQSCRDGSSAGAYSVPTLCPVSWGTPEIEVWRPRGRREPANCHGEDYCLSLSLLPTGLLPPYPSAFLHCAPSKLTAPSLGPWFTVHPSFWIHFLGNTFPQSLSVSGRVQDAEDMPWKVSWWETGSMSHGPVCEEADPKWRGG